MKTLFKKQSLFDKILADRNNIKRLMMKKELNLK